jgi:hypothetical protein
VFKKNGRSVVRQMVETGVMNDNEIVVKRGVSVGELVLLTPPVDRTEVSTEIIKGLQPITAPTAGGDTAKNVKIPAKAPVAAPAPPAAAPSATPVRLKG